MEWVLLVLVLAALGIAFTVAERRVVSAVHDRAAESLTRAFEAPVDVQLRGRPLLWHLARHRLPSVHLVAHDVPLRGGVARMARLDVELVEVTLPRLRSAGSITAERGSFVGRLSEPDAIALVTLPPGARILRLTDRGFRLATTLPGVRVDARVTLRGDSLVITPDRGLLTTLPWPPEVVVPLPKLPAGARIEQLRIHGRMLIFSGPLDGSRLQG